MNQICLGAELLLDPVAIRHAVKRLSNPASIERRFDVIALLELGLDVDWAVSVLVCLHRGLDCCSLELVDVTSICT